MSWRHIRYRISSKWRCLCDQICDLIWHTCKVRSALELYVAIGRRGRNGIHVYWSTLDPEEQVIYAKLVRADMQKDWHRARELAGLKRLFESSRGIGENDEPS
jgi:hypothetical protein